mgnify:CR=1 FL=1
MLKIDCVSSCSWCAKIGTPRQWYFLDYFLFLLVRLVFSVSQAKIASTSGYGHAIDQH